MIDKKLADEITSIAIRQRTAGMKIQGERMNSVKVIEDIYNNKALEIPDNRINIPFPVLSGHIDNIHSKIDNPPSVTFKIPNRPRMSDLIAAAWENDKSVMRADWIRKDRLEKKLALVSGRGISNVYSTRINGEYKAHYDVIDHMFFYCEGTKEHLEDNLYCGRVDIYKTQAQIKKLAEVGVYDKAQAKQLLAAMSNRDTVESIDGIQNKYNRAHALGLSPENNAYVGQPVVNFFEHQMDYEGERYYLLINMQTKTWVRAEILSDIFAHDRYSYTTWAVNEEKGNFWSKGAADDILPVAEAIKMTLNEVLENNRRINRPMRMVEGGTMIDVNQLQDYIPDNVMITNPGKAPNISTVETPGINGSINLVDFLRGMISQDTGVSGPGMDDTDVKVGVFFGTLEQEADRIGIINKAYNNSYAQKGYRYFWSLKKNLKEKKAVEMLGKDGFHWEELTASDLADVDDVDDIITSGGSTEEQLNEIKAKRKSESLAAITSNPALAQELSVRWLLTQQLEVGGWSEDQVKSALDKEGAANNELLQEADEAIQQLLLGKQPRLNRGANIAFMQRLLDWTIDNLDYVKLNAKGEETGIDERMKKDNDKILAYMQAHQKVVVENLSRDLRQQQAEALAQQPPGEGEDPNLNQVNIAPPSEMEQQASAARPFENPVGTPGGTASLSQEASQTLSP